MFIALLYISAFMFFIAERKIRNSFLAGITVTLFASWPFSYRIVYKGYKIVKFAGQFIPNIDHRVKSILYIIFTILISVLFTGILMLLARLWSRELFLIPRDESKSRKMSKRIFVSASAIPGVIALWLYGYKTVAFDIGWPEGWGYFAILFDHIGVDFIMIKPVRYITNKRLLGLMRTANTFYVVLLLALCILFIILINKGTTFSYKNLQVSSERPSPVLPAASITFSISGIITFLTIIQTGYYCWSADYRLGQFIVPFYYSYIYGSYNAYDHVFYNPVQYTFCMFVLGVLAAGIVILLISMIYMTIRKMIRQNLFSYMFSIVLIFISSGCIYKMLTEIEKFHSIRN